MGIFDASNYAPEQSGLIDRLMQSLGVQGQYQPGAGFPQSPMDASAAVPAPQPQQASPIDVGGYSMPRIGAASGFQLPAGQLDPATGDHVAPPQPQAAPLPAQLQPPGTGLGDHVIAGLGNFASSHGLLPAIANSVNGFMTGQHTDPTSVANAAVQQRFQAYVAAGIPRDKAILAAIDPESAKTIIPQALGPQNVQSLGAGYVWDPRQGKAVKAYEPDDKFKVVQTGENGIGGKQFEVLNPADGTHVPIKPDTADTAGGLGDPNLSGKDYLASIPPQQRGIVQAMVEGRHAPPSSLAMSKPYWQNMIAAANNVDSSFDQTTWPARVAGMKSFKSGADAGTVRSANQVLGHISDLTDKADELHNGDYPSLNYVKNTFNSQTGSDAPNNWVTQAHAVGDELSSFMKGAGHSSDTEIKQWQDSLSPNMSPTQQRGAIKTLMGIYDHALSALEDKRTGAIGSVAAEKLGPLVTSAGQNAMDKVRKWAGGNGSSGPANGGTAPTGVKWSVVQ